MHFPITPTFAPRCPLPAQVETSNHPMTICHILALLTVVCPAIPQPQSNAQIPLLLRPENTLVCRIPDSDYRNLFRYLHLIDIAYCVGGFSRISPPFDCPLDCAELFPHMTLVHQWCCTDSVCGYMASTDEPLFPANDTPNVAAQPLAYHTAPNSSGSSDTDAETLHNVLEHAAGGETAHDRFESAELPHTKLPCISALPRTVVVALRGTRSLADTLADLNIDMTPYVSAGGSVPPCGDLCKVHAGFHASYRAVVDVVEPFLETELQKGGPHTNVVVVGHSLGGAVALLVALHCLALGVENTRVVTMGQPLVGNRPFAEWADYVLGSELPVGHCRRRWTRVVHKNDIVATVPRGAFLHHYVQFHNQVYVNTSAADYAPALEDVIDCRTRDNPRCIAGDVLRAGMAGYLLAHNTYFRHLGLCGARVPA